MNTLTTIEHDYLRNMAEGNEFFSSLLTQYNNRGTLSEKQLQIIRDRMKGKRPVRLTNAQRGVLKREITKNAGWPKYSADTGILSRNLSSTAQVYAACDALGINVLDTLDKRGRSAGTSRRRPPATDRHESTAEGRSAGANETGGEDTSEGDNATDKAAEGRSGAENKPGEHPRFPALRTLCGYRDGKGRAPNILLVGPAGTGKTTAAEKIADEFDVPFTVINKVTEAHDLAGYYDPLAKCYKSTAFVRAITSPGVILCDEFDSWESAAQLVANSLLANGYMTIDSNTEGGETIYRHPDCVIIAAGNTWGHGATEGYQRNAIDASILSRFPVKLAWGYDEEFEYSLAGDNLTAQNWVREIQCAREAQQSLGLPVTADLRVMLEFGLLDLFAATKVREMTYLAGYERDEKQAVIIKTVELMTNRGYRFLK